MNAIEINTSGKALISSLSQPTDTEARALTNRRDELRRGLQPAIAGRQLAIELAKRILRMFSAWPVIRMDEDKAASVAKTYAEQLEHLPFWAVEAGISDAQHRNNAFPPSAGELRAACEKRAQPFRAELAEIETLLNAEVYQQNSEIERDRMKRGFNQLLKDITSKRVVSKSVSQYQADPDECAVAKVAEMTRETQSHGDPLAASDRLLAVLKERG